MRQPLNVTVSTLRAEHHADPLGLGTSSPRLSWIVEADDDFRQHVYEVALDDPDGDGSVRITESVRSDESVLVPWPFPPLTSRARRQVRVRVSDAGGRGSAWSEPLDLEVALLEPSDWAAVPITADGVGEDPERPVRFRRAFAVRAGLRRARLYASALGVHTTWLNGSPVGDEVLAPGWTSYGHRLRYRTSDVTAALAAGPNVIGMTVAEGWYRGRLGFRGGRRAVYGDDIGPIAQLELSYDDGTVETIATGAQRAHDGEEWRASADWRLSASLYDGESADGRLAEPDWATPGFHDGDWLPVRELASVASTLVAASTPPVRRIETRRAVSVQRAPSGAAIVDFGQNVSGRVRFRVRGRRGTRSPCATPRCSRTASSPRGCCAPRRRPTATSWPVARRRATSRSSRSTGSSTPGSTAGPASSTSAPSRPSSATRT